VALSTHSGHLFRATSDSRVSRQRGVASLIGWGETDPQARRESAHEIDQRIARSPSTAQAVRPRAPLRILAGAAATRAPRARNQAESSRKEDNRDPKGMRHVPDLPVTPVMRGLSALSRS